MRDHRKAMVGLGAVNIADVLEGWSLPNTDITFLALVSHHFGFNGVFTEALVQFGSFAPASIIRREPIKISLGHGG